MQLSLYTGLAGLPHFNPDLDGERPPTSVADLRALLRAADALVVSSPEYAAGIPGSFKNALDWVVGSGELYNMPVGLINATPGYGGGSHAQAALALTLRTQGALIADETTLSIAAVRQKLDNAGNVTDEATDAAIRALLTELARKTRMSARL